jgi:hypothetical protein
MSNSLENGASNVSLRAWHGWWPLAVTLSLSAILVALILWSREDKPKSDFTPHAAFSPRIRMLPRPPIDMAAAIDNVEPTHFSVVSEERDGVQVFRIRTHGDGDELIVDALTGRLLAVRDSKGKITPWPLSPLTAIEHRPKAS